MRNSNSMAFTDKQSVVKDKLINPLTYIYIFFSIDHGIETFYKNISLEVISIWTGPNRESTQHLTSLPFSQQLSFIYYPGAYL